MLFNGGLVPTYINYTNMINVKNTFWALLIPSLLCNGFNVLLMKSYFVSSIPDEILEAASIDGGLRDQDILQNRTSACQTDCSDDRFCFSGIGYWNDWMNGFIYLTKRTDLYSIQNLLNRMMQNIQFLTQYSTNIKEADIGLASIPSVSIRMSMAVVGILPILVIYPFIQNNFVKGITLGGVKG